MIDSKVTLDIRKVLLELKLSMEQLEEANVLNPVNLSNEEIAYMSSPELLAESVLR